MSASRGIHSFVVPLGLTLLAFFFRAYRLDGFVRGVDHSYPLAQAVRLALDGEWPVVGQYTSVLFDNPPGMPYLVLLPWLIFRNVWGVHLAVILLNSLSVPLLYASLRRVRRSEAESQVAAGLLAVNPWAVYHSQGAWVQGLLPVLITLVFSLLALAVAGPARRRGLRLMAAAAGLALMTQTYLLAFFTTAQAAAALALNWRRPAWRAVVMGALILAAPTAWYAAGLAARWPEQSAKLAGFVGTNANLQLNPAALEHALRLVTGNDYEAMYGNDGSPAWQARHEITRALSAVLALSVAAGLAYGLRRSAGRAPDAGLWRMVLAWWLLPIAAMSAGGYPIHIHYLLLSLPAGYVLAAPALAWALRSGAVRLAAAAGLAALFGLNLHADREMTLAKPAGGSLERLSVQAALPLQRAVSRLVDAYELEEIYVRWDSASLTANTGRSLEAVSWQELPQFQIIPVGRPALYLRLDHGQPASPPLLAQPAAQLDFAGDDHIRLDLIPALSRTQIAALPPQAVEWPTAEGLTLVGYGIGDKDRDVEGELIVYYAVEALAEGRQQWLYAPYAHFSDAQGQVLANIGVAGIPGYLYRLGDVYVYRMPLPDLPPGPYQLELGLYDGVHGLGVTFLPPGADPRPNYTAPISLP